MPNWVTNRLCFKGEAPRVKELLDFVKSDYGVFDFNKIIPKSEILERTVAGYGVKAESSVVNFKTPIRDIISKGEYDPTKMSKSWDSAIEGAVLAEGQMVIVREANQEELKELEKVGSDNWYDWCNLHWNTKWNASDPNIIGYDQIEFQTAWEDPTPVLVKLSEIFPDIVIEHVFADEDIGSNTGIGSYADGVENMYYPADQSEQAYEIVFGLDPDLRKYYRKTDDGYEYISDEEREQIEEDN